MKITQHKLIFEQRKIKLSGYKIYGFISEGNFIISPHYQPRTFEGDTILWIFSDDLAQKTIMVKCKKYTVKTRWNKENIITFNSNYEKNEYPNRPACDFFGNFISLTIPHATEFLEAYAHFYWDNLLPQIAERTFLLKKEDIRDGYVLSTLNKRAYAGTYPAVDHEFHIKGRYAVGGKAESSLIKRMLLLQLKIMREDELGLSRNVCAVQPNRNREYDVWRHSQDHKFYAQMFRITANIEFIEALYLYYSMSKDISFVRDNIIAVEKNCAYIERFIEKDYLINSHVHFEDQVIKDGKVTQSQCFAVNSFRLMAKLESLIGNNEKAEYYKNLATNLGDAIIKNFPEGYWDPKNNRFIDWIDGNGQSHDHIHLLANEMPCLLGLATETQQKAVEQLIQVNDLVFSKFPSFVAAKIEDYTSSEIGTGGPYDLCAAGRYWCWDAIYKASKNEREIILKQLLQVITQAKLDKYLMGERYDMNYIYYIDDKNWHGASLYYEYPNVFLFVLINQYLGINFGFDCDLIIKPLIIGEGTVYLPNYGIQYCIDKESFSIENLKNIDISMMIDLSGIGKNIQKKITIAANQKMIL